MSVTQEPAYQPVPRPETDPDEIEIRLSDIIDFLKESRWLVLCFVLAFLVIGVIYAVSQSNVYTAQVTVMPEAQSSGARKLGGLGSLAGLAGISLDNLGGEDAIRPELYPTVLQSIPFALNLLKQPVYSSELGAKLPLGQFTRQMRTKGWLGGLTNLFSGSNEDTSPPAMRDPKNFSQAIEITKGQDELIKVVQQTVSAAYDKKTGVITVVAVEPDPVVAATVARLSLEYLTDYITNYRTEKARQQVTFLAGQVRESNSKYQASEYALSNYRDKNRNLFLNTAKIEEQRLQADYLLNQSVYNELSKQFAQAKIKVQEETPVFKVLEPATVPLRKSGPKRTIIVLGFAVLGGILGLVYALFRRWRRVV